MYLRFDNDTYSYDNTKTALTINTISMSISFRWVTYKGLFGAIREMTLWYTYVAEIVGSAT